MGNRKFFMCKRCGNIANMIESSGMAMTCCGETMSELVPSVVADGIERHLPDLYARDGYLQARIGTELHPMTGNHIISFIYVETERGGMYKTLKSGDNPRTDFIFSDDKPVAVYSYCNLHGLWKADVHIRQDQI